jgi:hypothetical protein
MLQLLSVPLDSSEVVNFQNGVCEQCASQTDSSN